MKKKKQKYRHPNAFSFVYFIFIKNTEFFKKFIECLHCQMPLSLNVHSSRNAFSSLLLFLMILYFNEFDIYRFDSIQTGIFDGRIPFQFHFELKHTASAQSKFTSLFVDLVCFFFVAPFILIHCSILARHLDECTLMTFYEASEMLSEA